MFTKSLHYDMKLEIKNIRVVILIIFAKFFHYNMKFQKKNKSRHKKYLLLIYDSLKIYRLIMMTIDI